MNWLVNNLLMQYPSRSDLLTTAMYWLVATPFILWTYVAEFGWARAEVGIAYTVLLDTAAVYLLVFGVLPGLLDSRQRSRALIWLLGFLLGSAILYHGGYGLLLGKDAVRWTLVALLSGLLLHAKSYGLLAVLLTGKRYFEIQRRVLQLQKAQAESELRSLKAQLDPHFLFNNLNVLRGLILEDPVAANEYLTRLAALYRFLIRHQNEDVVSLAEELQFANEYIYLLRHRFGSAYEFRQELPSPAVVAELLVVPGTLQLLLENAIKHNAGNEDEPLVINMKATVTCLTVRHVRRPKRTPVDSSGTGLANLRERYRLLFGQEIQVETTPEVFVVTVPLLPLAHASGLSANYQHFAHDYSDFRR